MPQNLKQAHLSRPYGERRVVGRFRVLVGLHAEGGREYFAGDVVESYYNLNRHNPPGCQKFEQVGELDQDAIAYNDNGSDPRPGYQPENPQTLQPGPKQTFEQTGQVPAMTGEQPDREALAAGGIRHSQSHGGGDPQGTKQRR